MKKNITKENRFRNKSILTRCTDDEYKFIKYNQKLSGYRFLSDFVRKCCIDQKIVVIDKDFLREQNLNLNKIGTNINQIAHKVNIYNKIYDREVEELKDSINNIIEIFIKLYDFI